MTVNVAVVVLLVVLIIQRVVMDVFFYRRAERMGREAAEALRRVHEVIAAWRKEDAERPQ